MTDKEIEEDLKSGFSSLSDIFSFIKNAPEECKDGYANLFYLKECVVNVYWVADAGVWIVRAWGRDGLEWNAGSRVFSPATGSQKLESRSLGYSDPLDTLPEQIVINGITYKRV